LPDADYRAKFFNPTVTILDAHKFSPKKVYALPDASEIESTAQCFGRGTASKEKAPELRLRQGRIKTVVDIILVVEYGWYGISTVNWLWLYVLLLLKFLIFA
jgi:hypothetical protein